MVMTIVMFGLFVVVVLLGLAHIAALRRRGRAEREAIDSERRYQVLAESSFDMIVRFDPSDQRRTYISQACRRLYGYEPDEALDPGSDTGGRRDPWLEPEIKPLGAAGQGPKRSLQCCSLEREGHWLIVRLDAEIAGDRRRSKRRRSARDDRHLDADAQLALMLARKEHEVSIIGLLGEEAGTAAEPRGCDIYRSHGGAFYVPLERRPALGWLESDVAVHRGDVLPCFIDVQDLEASIRRRG